ncbi:hypothetical protein MMC17_003210 [Xylographa soralifera]|nr:hypothetical protein [Xylographa soralifera]
MSQRSSQIVCIWKKCLDLVELLEHANHGLPNLEIHLQDSEKAKWSVDGEPQRSVAVDRAKRYPPRDSVIDRSNEQTDNESEDYAIALTAFERLRSVKTAKIFLPDDIVCVTKKHLAHNIETILVEKESFGTSLNADDPWNDESIQEDLDQMFMDLDLELDMLPGFTASMMRLERFSSWYTEGLGSDSKYEREYGRILKTRSTCYHNYNKAQQIHFRYAAMRAFNPRSLYNRYKARRGDDTTRGSFSSPENKTAQETSEFGSIKEDYWDRDTWHNGCYSSGIPPFDHEQFFTTMWTASVHNDPVMEHEQKFINKLVGWMDKGDGSLSCRNRLFRYFFFKLAGPRRTDDWTILY